MPVTGEMLEMEARMHDRSDEQIGKIEERLAQTATRGEVAELRSEMVSGFAEMCGSLDRRLERLEGRFDRLNYILITSAIGIIVPLVGFQG
jgi:hypothetical protein